MGFKKKIKGTMAGLLGDSSPPEEVQFTPPSNEAPDALESPVTTPKPKLVAKSVGLYLKRPGVFVVRSMDVDVLTGTVVNYTDKECEGMSVAVETALIDFAKIISINNLDALREGKYNV